MDNEDHNVEVDLNVISQLMIFSGKQPKHFPTLRIRNVGYVVYVIGLWLLLRTELCMIRITSFDCVYFLQCVSTHVTLLVQHKLLTCVQFQQIRVRDDLDSNVV